MLLEEILLQYLYLLVVTFMPVLLHSVLLGLLGLLGHYESNSMWLVLGSRYDARPQRTGETLEPSAEGECKSGGDIGEAVQ